MKTETIKLYKIKSNPDNPRLIKDDKFHKLVKSIKEFPEMLKIRPIVVNDDLIVLGGNMRLKACKDAGLKEVSIIKASELTAEQQREFIVKDNVGFGEWDWNLIANEWDAEQLNDWGLDLPVDFNVVEEAEEDNYTEPDDLKVDVVLGDLIEIGEHRLLCGDSTDSDQVAKLMNGEKADLASNDPPYGMKKEKEGITNDNLNFDDLLQFNHDWITLQFSSVLKDNGSWYCWGIDEPLMDIYSSIIKPLIKTQKATFRNLITWNKGNGQGQMSDEFRSYAPADEKCLFVMCGVQGFNNNADNYFEGWENIRNWLFNEYKKLKITRKELNNLLGSSPNSCGGLVSHYFDKAQWSFIPEHQYKKIQDYCKTNNNDAFKKEYDELKKEYEELKKEYYSTRAYFNNVHDNMNNVWHFDRHVRQGNEGGHATPKPIPLCERVIKSSCPDGGLVIDSFLGSGSTMVAAHQLKRKCYGMELDPKYCQVIIDRMLKLDEKLEVKINGKSYGK